MKLIDYKSFEGSVLKDIFEPAYIDLNIAKIVESYIYKDVIKYGMLFDCSPYIKETYRTRFNKKEGEYILYSSDGIVLLKTNYKNGEIEGLCQIFYITGRLEYEIYYKNELKNGIYKKFHHYHGLKEKGYYLNDKREGKYIEYYSRGNIKVISNFKNDKLEGKYIEYYPNKQILKKCFYKNDRNYGLYETFYDNGQIRSKYYTINNDIDNYTNKCKRWHKNGNIDLESKGYRYKFFSTIILKEWYSNGKIKNIINMHENTKHGLYRSWYRNGKIHEISRYFKGKKVLLIKKYEKTQRQSNKND